MTNNLLKLESYELPDLAKEICSIWSSPDKWRLSKGKIEFHLPCSDGYDGWFPLYQAPEIVVKYVKSWVRSGGLSFQERIDI